MPLQTRTTMITHPGTPRHRGWIPSLTILCLLAGGHAAAQDFALRVADSDPLGIGRFVPTGADLLQAEGGIETGMKGAFALNAALQTVYDSNFFLTENNRESEVSVLFEPTISYTSDPEGGAIYSLTANYAPTFRAFLDNSDLNDIDHSGDVEFRMVGSRTDVTLFARYNELSGTDRLTGSFNSGWVFTGGVRAIREIASRTTLNGGVSYSVSDFDTGGIEGSTIYSAYFGGMWRATERTSVGSTLRYSCSEADTTGERDAVALLAEARYQVGERIWLSASLGPEFASDSGGGDNTVNLSADLDCRYIINERWSWTNSLRTATVPSPSSTGYVVNNYGFVTELEHKLLRATLRGGLEFNYSEYEDVGTALVQRDDEQTLSLFLGYNRAFFNERLSFDSTVRYTTNSGDEDWNQWLLSLGLSMPF